MSTNGERPNPEKLLAQLRAHEADTHRGKLKIFFGYAAGVGKTFAMLEAAQRERSAGVDVVVGYVEPHGRAETEALVHGLEVLPPRLVPYHGVTLREFDLDAALARRPRLLLVDELAHTNAEGCRHTKRWQDVEELVAAGIDVYTSLNVQHIESLNDVIAQITGVVVRETLPDVVLEKADDFELIDLTPEELIDRLKSGKVYLPAQAERALRNYFQQANLTALRELSLRQVANRLHQDVEIARQQKSAAGPWATGERLLVCVGPSPTSAKLIRTAKRMAAAFGAEWLAVAVATRGPDGAQADHRERVAHHLRLAEQLGAETHQLIGEDVADALLDYARSRNVTKIVVGKTAVPWWKRLLRPTVVDALLERSGEIDIYVIKGEAESQRRTETPPPPPDLPWPHYLATAGVIAGCGFLGWISQQMQLAEANMVMIFLLGTVLVAARFGRGPAIFAAVANVLVFDFFFVPPFLSFAVSDAQYLITFGVMLGIGLLISTLTARIRGRLRASQEEERRTDALFRLTKQMSEVAGVEFLVRTAGRQLSDVFDGEVVLYLRESAGQVALRFGESTTIAGAAINAVVAAWVADHNQMAGAGTDTLPNATALFVPMIGSQRTVGALGVKPADPQRFLDPQQRLLLETCASLIALSMERDLSVLEAHQAQLQVQTEQLRNALLNSVSHDLRTPLAAIAGASSSLLENTPSPEARTELLQSIVDESSRLARLVDNLLDMTRLQSGNVVLNKQWHVLEEIVGSAIARLRREVVRHTVRADIPGDLPLLMLDGVLFEQVLFNLLENALRYTPAGSRIDITAHVEGKRIEIRVADNGPGLPPGDEARVFEKFFRGPTTAPDGRRGVGLGLAICHGIVEAHGGRISAHNRPTGGAEFVISLPCDEPAPRVDVDEVCVSASPQAT